MAREWVLCNVAMGGGRGERIGHGQPATVGRERLQPGEKVLGIRSAVAVALPRRECGNWAALAKREE